MNDEDHQPEELRERIASLIRANEQAGKAPVTPQELEKLNAAANRLDQMLKAATDADRQALRDAAARLDQLLSDISAGKDVTNYFKRREGKKDAEKGN